MFLLEEARPPSDRHRNVLIFWYNLTSLNMLKLLKKNLIMDNHVIIFEES